MSNRENTPSLGGLIFALRHKETWPADFVWNFARCETCAMGLAYKLWPRQVTVPDTESMIDAFGMKREDAARIFGSSCITNDTVTPEHIADQLEALV